MELQISMIPSPDDPPWRSDDYQSGLRSLGVALRADGLEVREIGVQSVREGCITCISGEWRVKLGDRVGPALKAPVGFWLQARRGRTVRLTIGETEADVQTAEELVSAIKIARSYEKISENES